MDGDLFSTFDVLWGGGFFVFWLVLWFGCYVKVLFYLSYKVYFHYLSLMEGLFYKFSEMMNLNMSSEKVSVFGGGVHIFICLFIVLLMMNFSSLLPLLYPLSIHLIITCSFSVPFWLMSVLVNFNFNWKLFFVSQIESSNNDTLMTYVVSLMMMVSEMVSIMVRPITLCARLSMNLFIGQMIAKILTSVSVGIFYPFCYYLNYGSWFFISLFMLVLSILYYIVEVFVAVLQSIIFTGLCVFYVSEVKMKVE